MEKRDGRVAALVLSWNRATATASPALVQTESHLLLPNDLTTLKPIKLVVYAPFLHIVSGDKAETEDLSQHKESVELDLCAD